MSNISERLDQLKAQIQTTDFLKGYGLANEANIRIFCYNIEDEMVVEDFLNRLLEDTHLKCTLHECNLYKTFIEICEEEDIIEGIVDKENQDGSEDLLNSLCTAIVTDDYIRRIHQDTFQGDNDIILITGVGDSFPFMRVHDMLEALQPHFIGTPILVMYPGNFDTHQLQLFNRLKPNNYYRAFNLI